MAERKQIGIYTEMPQKELYAAFVYLSNIINGFNLLEEKSKPNVTLIYTGLFKESDIKEIKYPYLETYNAPDVYKSSFKRLVNKISRRLFRKNILPFFDSKFPRNLDIIYPANTRSEIDYVKEKIFWKPDFQEKHYPEYFAKSYIELFDKNFSLTLNNPNNTLVLSSLDCFNDLKKFFPEYKCKVFVLPFVVFMNYKPSKELSKKILDKFSINAPYFIVPNQFWPHKNHITVIKAIKLLKKTHSNFKVIFTGHTSTNRNKLIYEELIKYCEDNDIMSDLIFTSFLPKNEQLDLINNSICLIQPSLFEGWNTSIEEAKYLNKFVIASDIAVHKEQLSENVLFFSQKNEQELCESMKSVLDNRIELKPFNYNTKVVEFVGKLKILFNL